MTLFSQAHALTRATIQAGDNYQATFILCLRSIIADAKSHLAEHSGNTVFEAINYQAPVVAKAKRIVKAIDFDVMLMIGFILLLISTFALGVSAISSMDKRNKASFDALYANDTAQVLDTSSHE